MDRDEAFRLADVLARCANGYGDDREVGDALRRLKAIGQYNLRTNVLEFRDAMKGRVPPGISGAREQMFRNVDGIRGALGNFVYQDAPD